MSEGKMQIEVQYSTDGLFDNAAPAIYNEAASVARFGEALERHLHSAYPDARIEVSGSIIDVIKVDGRADHNEVPWIVSIVEKIWNSDDWLVGK